MAPSSVSVLVFETKVAASASRVAATRRGWGFAEAIERFILARQRRD